MASVTSRNKEVVNEKERLKVEMEREKQLARAAKLAQEELDMEKKKYEEELKILTEDRENFRKQAGIFLKI
jgi:predicted YcjX-like family ATPase